MAQSSARPTPRAVYVDTSAYYAAIDSKEKKHAAVSNAVQQFAHQGWSFYTTPLVLAEVHALVLSRHGIARAYEAAETIWNDQGTTILHATREDFTAAFQLLKKYDDKTFSLADALSFVLIEKRGLGTVLACDEDFRRYTEGTYELAP